MTFPRVLSWSALALLAFGLVLGGCNSSSPGNSNPLSSVRNYNGTASVGDFLTISLDPSAQTITYNNLTNGQQGTVPYTKNSDGSYAITDPTGNLLVAYEVPGFVMVVESAKSGPSQNTPALITAIETAPASLSSFAGKNFNYLQFRTAAGGLEIGTVTIDGQGNITHDGYWPMTPIAGGGSYFTSGTFPASSIQEDSSGNFFTITEQDSSKDVVFGTQNGLWAVDTGNGAVLGLPKAASPSFDPASAGTYTAIYYEKLNARTGMGNVETGTPSEGIGTVVVSANASVTITGSQGNTLATGTLVPVANTSYLYDGTGNTLSDPCNGLFTVRTTAGGIQQDLFVSFQGNAAIFASFQTALPFVQGGQYTYFYGVGLK